MQPDRILTKPFVLTMLAEFALCMSVGMLLAVVPVYADRRPRRRAASASPSRSRRSARWCSSASRSPGGMRTGTAGGSSSSQEACSRRSRLLPTSSRLAALLVVLRLLTGTGEAMALVGAATIVTDLAPEHRRGEALSVFSLGLWGGLALGPLLGELVLDDTRYDAVWLLAAACCLAAGLVGLAPPGDGAGEGRGAGIGSPTRPSRGGRAGPRALVHRPRLRRSRDVRRALCARPRTRRRRFRLPRVLRRRRCDAGPRAAGARPARAEAHVPNRARAHRRRVSSRSGSGTSLPGCSPGPSSSRSAMHLRSRRS